MAEQANEKGEANSTDEDPELSPGVIIGVVAGLIVITVLIFTVFGGSDDSGDSTTAPPPPVAVGPAPPTPIGPATTVTTLPEVKEVTGLPDGAPTDAFDRPDADTAGPGWEELGTWGVRDGHLANIVQDDDAGREFVLRNPGAGDLTVAAVVIEAAEGTGMVFRFQDDQNYWLLAPAPKYGTWVVNKYEAGTSTLVGNTGLASSAENTAVVLELSGSEIVVEVDGKQVASFDDPYLASATKVGFASGGFGAQRARWDSFYALVG